MSSFARLTALGGGYGGSAFSYHHGWVAGAGGSGGGGRAWSAWSPEWGHEAEYGLLKPLDAYTPGDGSYWDYGQSQILGGVALGGSESWNSTHPYPGDEPPEGGTGSWTNPADGLSYWTVSLPRGHAGHVGSYPYTFAGGGGGGAHIEGYFAYDQYNNVQSANPFHGGHGRPCDIRGWWMYEETAKTLMYVDWYAGGGAAGCRTGGGWTWSPVFSRAGYAGGEMAIAAAVNSGGGGGGGYQGVAYHPGGNGGRGIVVVRIPRANEGDVLSPAISGYDPEDTEFGLPVCLCDDTAVRIRHLPQYMTHDDCSGDEQCPRTYAELH